MTAATDKTQLKLEPITPEQMKNRAVVVQTVLSEMMSDERNYGRNDAIYNIQRRLDGYVKALEEDKEIRTSEAEKAICDIQIQTVKACRQLLPPVFSIPIRRR